MSENATEARAKIRLTILALLAQIKGFGKTRDEIAALVFLTDNANAVQTGETVTGATYNRLDGPIMGSCNLGAPSSDGLVIESVLGELIAEELTTHPGYAPWLDASPEDRYRLDPDDYSKGYAAGKELGARAADSVRSVANRYGGLSREELWAVIMVTRAYKRSLPQEIAFERSESVIAAQRWRESQPGFQEFKEQALAALKDMEGKEWITHEELMRELGEPGRGDS